MSDEYRDERGRWLPGVPNGGPRPGGGRPREGEAERIRAALRDVLDDETLQAWAEAMRRKISKGNLAATEFLFDRVLGRPGVVVQVSPNDGLQRFLVAWERSASDSPEDPAGELPAGSDETA